MAAPLAEVDQLFFGCGFMVLSAAVGNSGLLELMPIKATTGLLTKSMAAEHSCG